MSRRFPVRVVRNPLTGQTGIMMDPEVYEVGMGGPELIVVTERSTRTTVLAVPGRLLNLPPAYGHQSDGCTCGGHVTVHPEW